MRDNFFKVDPAKLGPYYILEVDLEYPTEIHDRDDDYPMASQMINVRPETLSETQHRLLVDYFNGRAPGSKKLICSFLPRIRNTVFGQNLQFYLSRGMKRTKVHRVIKFTALDYISAYIKLNTNMRQTHRGDERKKLFQVDEKRTVRKNYKERSEAYRHPAHRGRAKGGKAR